MPHYLLESSRTAVHKTSNIQNHTESMLPSIQSYAIPSSVKRVFPVAITRLRDISSSLHLTLHSCQSSRTTRKAHDVTARRRAAAKATEAADTTRQVIHSFPSQTFYSTQVQPSSQLLPLDVAPRRLATPHFDNDYREQVLLRDGTHATLRFVRPSDHDLWVDGFSRLSVQSRYNRFCAAKKRLTEKEIQYFTNVDQNNHFAIVAVSNNEDGNEIGLGVARFIRSKDDPRRAEPAITVTDDAQSQGLGTLLARRLAMAAKERGIESFDSSVLGSNTKVIHLIKEVAPTSMFRRYGPDTVVSTKLFEDDKAKLMSAA